jgi:hypothetical protein
LTDFNERWTNVLFGKAQNTLASTFGGQQASTSQGDDQED